jgi:hypothetical protein
MSEVHDDKVSAAQARHRRAVARTLERADEAAERGDHITALGWLQTLQAIGDHLSSEYQRKRGEWRTATERGRTRTSVSATPRQRRLSTP